MTFTESNTVEAYVRDLLAVPIKATPPNAIQEPLPSYGPSVVGWVRRAARCLLRKKL
jgi:type I restriction enzyme, R subunit